MAAQLLVEIKPITTESIQNIEQQWRELDAKTERSIFTSWHWMATWLTFINYNTQLLKITYLDEIVGLGFINQKNENKNGFIAKQLWLNRTGNNTADQIWNEYNDILCAEGYEYAIRAALLEYFTEQLPQHNELIIGVSDKKLAYTPISHKLMQYTSWCTTSYSTSLTNDFADIENFLQTLSANTRSQIKRSAKLLGGFANIKIEKAQTVEEALSFFKATGVFHKIRWENKNSGFENPKFLAFHQSFIRDNFDNNCIDILRISTSEKTFCYLYNFKYRNTVYFYLSGIEYSNDNRFKPGLLSHSLAIAYYASQGYTTYDFMGGEGRYKNSLSNNQGTMIISNYRRKNLPFMLSHCYRKLKSTWIKKCG